MLGLGGLGAPGKDPWGGYSALYYSSYQTDMFKVYIYIYMYVCIYIYIYTYIHAYIHTYIYIYILCQDYNLYTMKLGVREGGVPGGGAGQGNSNKCYSSYYIGA